MRLHDRITFVLPVHTDRQGILSFVLSCSVPLIFTTALIFLSAWDLSSSLPASFVKVFSTITDLPLTAAVPAAALYVAFYLYLVPNSLGAAAATLMLAQLGLSAWFRHELPGRAGMTLAVIIHVVAWIAQFYGHGVHEKRSPALIDNLFQVRHCCLPLCAVVAVSPRVGWQTCGELQRAGRTSA